MKISIEDVAKKADVSVVTVSRVINNVETVRSNNRKKVLKAMEELNYTPSAAARSLALGTTKVIGLTLSTFNDSFFDGIVKSVSKNLESYGYLLVISFVPSEKNSPTGSRSFLDQSNRVDGLILLAPQNEEAVVVELKKKNIPYVLIDNQKQHGDSSVIVNNFKGGYEATKHLIELGHTKIAHVGGPDIFLSSREREKGYIAALKDAGLEPFLYKRSGFTIDGGYDVANKWIDAGKIPTAIFAADDYISLGVMNAFMDRGMRVPEDISVVGYDDQHFTNQFRPKLTTIKQPTEELGKQGVDLLMKIINGESKSSTIMLDPELVIRESTMAYKKITSFRGESLCYCIS
jgi:DNA-binding LacI/PurR family transcriptional regulator